MMVVNKWSHVHKNWNNFFYFKYFCESTMWMIKPLGGLVTIVQIILSLSVLFIFLVLYLSKLATNHLWIQLGYFSLLHYLHNPIL